MRERARRTSQCPWGLVVSDLNEAVSLSFLSDTFLHEEVGVFGADHLLAGITQSVLRYLLKFISARSNQILSWVWFCKGSAMRHCCCWVILSQLGCDNDMDALYFPIFNRNSNFQIGTLATKCFCIWQEHPNLVISSLMLSSILSSSWNVIF